MSELRRVGSLVRIGDLLDERLATWKLDKELRIRTAIGAWDSLVGPHIAASAQPQRIHRGSIYVSVKSSVWAQEIRFIAADVLKRLNELVGEPLLTDLRCFVKPFSQQGHVAPAGGEPTEYPTLTITPDALSSAHSISLPVQPTELRTALARAIAASKSLQEWRDMNGWIRCAKCNAYFVRSRRNCPLCECASGNV